MAGKTYAGAKKSFYGFYFAIAERVIFNIVHNPAICVSSNIVHYKCSIAFYYYFRKINMLEELTTRSPALFFKLCNRYMIVVIWAGKSKAICKLCCDQVPILFFKSAPKGFYTLFRSL